MDKELLPAFDSVIYSYIFSDTNSQHQIKQVFRSIIQTRELLRAPRLIPAYPGYNTGLGDYHELCSYKEKYDDDLFSEKICKLDGIFLK